MAEKEASPTGQPEMVSMKDLKAVKAARDNFKTERDEAKAEQKALNAKIAELERSIKVARADGADDEEVVKVKDYLLKQAEEMTERETKFQKDLTDFEKRERSVRAGELAVEYGIKKDDILGADEEDLEKVALKLKLSQGSPVKEDKSPESQVFESGLGGMFEKKPSDMSDEEFETQWEKMKTEASQK